MALMRAFGSNPIHADAFDLEAKLWDLDPRLQLRYITREHPERKGVIGRRYEVWRTNEDGSEGIIGHWLLTEFDAIYPDILAMKNSAEGTAPSTIEQLDAHNAEVDDKIHRQFRDSWGEAMEHAAKLWHDTNNPKNVFRQVGGLRDSKVIDVDPTHHFIGEPGGDVAVRDDDAG